MKKIFLLLLTIFSSLVIGQTYNIGSLDGTTQTTCSGTFVDDGAGSNYGTNRDDIITFCPSQAGDVIKVVFTQLCIKTANSDPRNCQDWLYVFQGNAAYAAANATNPDDIYCGTLTGAQLPVVISSSADGCITFRFQSTNAQQECGWTATVSCVTPCKNPTANLVNSSTVNICSSTATNGGIVGNPGNYTVSFDASNSTVGAYVAPTSHSIVSYNWDFGDGSTSTTGTATTSHNYSTPGVYKSTVSVVDNNFDIVSTGCASTNAITKEIYVVPPPDLNDAGASATCGNCVDISATAESQTAAETLPTIVVSPTVLPDGNGTCYTNSVDYGGYFPNGSTMGSGCYPSVCFSISHSWARDLIITLIAPDGKQVRLYNRQYPSDETVPYFGACTNPTDGDADGCPRTYCISTNGTGTNWTAAGTTADNPVACAAEATCETGLGGEYYLAGTYNSFDPFSNLNGAPLNGVWTLQICDMQSLDDGTLNSWSLSFPASCLKNLSEITPDMSTITWTPVGGAPTPGSNTCNSTPVLAPGPDACPPGQTCPGNILDCDANVCFSGSASGNFTYQYTVTDDYTCQYQGDVTVSVSCNCSAVGTLSLSGASPICPGSCSELTFTLSGGATNYTVVYTDGTSNFTLTNISSGHKVSVCPTSSTTYQIVSVFDNSAGCFGTFSGSPTVVVRTLPVISGTLSVCVSSQTQLSANVGPAASNAWISSNTGVATISSTGLVTGVSAGTTTITYTDINGCTNTATVTVNPLPTISGTTTLCVNATSQLTGSATAASTTPWTSSNTSVATVSSTGFVTAFGAGTTTITYTNDNGCSQTTTVTVNALPTATISGTDTICSTGNATISVALTGTQPWSITYFNGSTSTTVSGITTSPYQFTTNAAGSYTITAVSDATGCTGTFSENADITVNTPIVISNIVATCTGTDYVVTFDFSGGNPALYSITGMNGGSITGSGPYTFTSNIINSLVDMNYSFTVVDAICGNQTVSGTKNCSCPVNGLLTGGGIACSGNPASDVVFTLTGGVSSPYTLVYSINGVSQTAVNVSTGFPNSTYTITNPAAGTYSIVSIEDVNCIGSGSGSVSVTIDPLPTVTLSGGGSTCSGTNAPDITVDLTGTGPWDITYTDGTTSTTVAGITTSPYVIPNPGAGTYQVTSVSDSKCPGIASNSVTVTINPKPVISGTLSVCINSTTQLSGTGTPDGSTPWTSTNTTIATVSNSGLVTGVAGGSCDIIYKDNNGCSDTVTVVVNDLPVITGTLTICANSTTQLTGSGTPDGTTPWTSSNTSVATIDATGLVTGLSGGTTTITYLDANGCSNTAIVTVNDLPSINGTTSICANSTSQLSGSGTPASSNPWVSSNTAVATITNSGLVAGISGGTSIITYTDNNGCSQTITITVFDLPSISGNPIICANTTTQLTGSGTPDGTTPWNSANTGVATVTSTGLVSGVASGTTLITYTDINGCSDTLTITVNPLPTATISGGGFVCAGSTTTPNDTITFGGTSGPWIFTYSYNDGTTTTNITDTTNINPFLITNPAFGTYTLIGVTDTITKCANTVLDSVFVFQSPNPSPVGSANVIDPTCGLANGSITNITVNGNAPLTLVWTDAYGNVISNTTSSTAPASADLFGLPGGDYTLYMTDGFGCKDTLNPAVHVDTSVAVVAVINANPTFGQVPLVVTFDGSNSVNETTYQWYFGTGDSSLVFNPSYTYDLMGNYVVTLIVTDGALCSDTATVTIVASDVSWLIIPNIITPNGDGSNELFTVKTKNIKSLTADVFDRWGVKMYSWDGVNGGWDGKGKNGGLAPEGTYYYIIKAEGYDDKQYNEKGFFQLLR